MTKRADIRKKLLDLVREIVIIRDESTCQHCKKVVSGSNRHLSHVVPVSATLSMAYDQCNLMILCYHCHINWWHKNPLEAADWFKFTFPSRWGELEYQKKQPRKPIKTFELEDLYEELKLIKKSTKAWKKQLAYDKANPIDD